MPFTKINRGKNRGKYRSPSGRVFTRRQVRRYYARGGTFDAAGGAATAPSGRRALRGVRGAAISAVRPPASRDPTRTGLIRRQFRADVERRLILLKRLTREAVVDHNMLGMGAPTAMSVMLGAHSGAQVHGFDAWFTEAAQRVVVGAAEGAWVGPRVAAAYDLGVERALAELERRGLAGRGEDGKADALSAACMVDLQGAVDATTHYVSRDVAAAKIRGRRPVDAYRAAAVRIDGVGATRLRAMVSTHVVRAYNEGKLDVYASAGLARVGILAETQPHRRRVGDCCTPPPQLIGQLRDDDMSVVEVLTAGDDDVCFECEDISANGPYSIDEAYDLIPAHPNCRCAFVPYFDERFSHEHEAGDAAWDPAKHPRAPAGSERGGEFARGGGISSGDFGDPTGQVVEADARYAYHATTVEHALDIAETGLNVHGPSYGTDQSEWPDGSTERRSYWTHDPQVARSFYPEGAPALLRVLRGYVKFKRESTGDLYLTRKVPATRLEFFASDQTWRSLASRSFTRDYNPYHEPAGSSRGGEFARAGSGGSAVGVGIFAPGYIARLQRAADSTSRQMGFDPRKVRFEVGVPRGPEGVGVTMGQYTAKDGVIRIFPMAFEPSEADVRRLLAHEITHHKFYVVAEAWNKEFKAMTLAERRLYNTPGVTFSDEFRKKFPVSTGMRPYSLKESQRHAREGAEISDYAAQFWDDVKRNKSASNVTNAVNETLAEVAQRLAGSSDPEFLPISNYWRGQLATINGLYDQVSKKR